MSSPHKELYEVNLAIGMLPELCDIIRIDHGAKKLWPFSEHVERLLDKRKALEEAINKERKSA